MTTRAFDNAVAWLLGLVRHGIQLGLEPTRTALAALGDPHLAYRTLHVAGTNGKGSTCAFAATILAQSGLRVGLYTSPHLQSFNERVVVLERGATGVARLEIGDGDVVELADEIRHRCSGQLTFFEATTVLAFEYFRRAAVDVVVLETGLGGRLDATNVCRPLATAITNVSLEHQAYLGERVEEIAAEKAGIIKAGVPVLTTANGPGQQAVLPVIAERAAALGSPLAVWPHDFCADPAGNGGTYRGPGGPLDFPFVGLRGAHQLANAALALALVSTSGLLSSAQGAAADAKRRGLAEVYWPGRFEIATQEPLVVLDAAHNPGAAAVLAEALRELQRERPQRKIRMIFGVLDDKNVEVMLGMLKPLVAEMALARPQSPRGREPASYAHLVTDVPTVDTSHDLGQAIEKLLARSHRDDILVIAGSCYLVGEARSCLAERTLGRAVTRGLLAGV